MRSPKTKSCAGCVLLLVGLLAHAPLSCGGDRSSGNRSSATRLRILVTNDDGVAADGIDAIVKVLIADPHNEVIVCAPSGNRSGSGDATGPSVRCGDLAVTAA